jgi:hypothetical protein
MCIIKNVFLIVTFASATKAISESVSICEPQLKSSWTYNYETNISDYSEINTNLETISLNFDFGFLKLSAQADGKYSLFRQAAIKRDADETDNITVRYEDTNKKTIGQKEIIVVDPMCIKGQRPRLNIIEFDDVSLNNIAYSCNCLSPVHGKSNFIY